MILNVVMIKSVLAEERLVKTTKILIGLLWRINTTNTFIGRLSVEISLIRHGKSKYIANDCITSYQFKDWVEKYNRNGIFEEETYPSETVNKVTTANMIITSDLKRSIDSAKILNTNVTAQSSSLFRETELPLPSSRVFGLKLKPSSWAFFLRCLWFLGYSRGCESLAQAKERARIAAELLVKHANQTSSVVFVGHGFFNRLLAKELQKMGWIGNRKISSKHWHCTTYSKRAAGMSKM